MVTFEVHTWHWMMVAAQLCSIACYLASILILRDTFDGSLMFRWRFAGQVVAVTLVFVLTCFHWEVVEAAVCSCALFKVSLNRSDGSCSKRECIIQMGGR